MQSSKNPTLATTNKRLDNLSNLIGYGTLQGESNIISQINKLNEIIKNNANTFKLNDVEQLPEKYNSVYQAISQLETVKNSQSDSLEKLTEQLTELKKQFDDSLQNTKVSEQTFTQKFQDNSAIIGSGKFQTTSQNITDAINELLSLINQTLNSNSIMIILDQLSDEMYSNEYTNGELLQLFIQQVTLQILNCGNVLTILNSAQDQVKEKKVAGKTIRYGIQGKSMFVEEYHLDNNDIEDIRFAWCKGTEHIDCGFYIISDYAPRIVKSYTQNIFQDMIPEDQYKDYVDFKGYMFGSLEAIRCMQEFNIPDRLCLKNIKFFNVKFNQAFDFRNCLFEKCEFQVKYHKHKSLFFKCGLFGNFINVPKFAEVNDFSTQLQFEKCNLNRNTVESAYLFDINDEQLTPEELSKIQVFENTFLIERQPIKEDFSWQLSAMTPQTFNACRFIIRDTQTENISELYIDTSKIQLNNCDLLVSSERYTQHTPQPYDKFAENGIITIDANITKSDSVLDTCLLSAKKVEIVISDDTEATDALKDASSGYKLYLINSNIYTDKKFQPEFQCQVKEDRYNDQGTTQIVDF